MTRHTLLTLLFSLLALAAYSQPRGVYDHAQHEMGDVLWKLSNITTFTLTNAGDAPLLIRDVRTDCGCTSVDYPQTAIAPGESANLTVSFDAQQLGHFTKYIGVYTNEREQPDYLTITGCVVTELGNAIEHFPFQVDDIYLSTDQVEFDDVHRGDTPQKVIMVLNGSKRNYEPTLMHLPKYLIAEASPTLLRPGCVGKITLTLNTRELHDMGLTQTDVYVARYKGDRVNKDHQIGISATLLPEFTMSERELSVAPVAVCDTLLDLSAQAGKKKMKGEVAISNTGQSPLSITALQVYNPGITVSISKQHILPGETVPLKVTINANSKYFKGRSRILLITNDPRRAKIAIDVRAERG
ncbi:MAG: DUF1573 domain-containing protein [Bacteroidales bacterium]|nr:DUF1573 domain-containing protein [Candidatus Equimonas enterica]